MKSLQHLLGCVLQECGTQCGVDTLRDSKTIALRVESEGESFMTITLPTFTKSLERALDQGRITSDLFHGFAIGKGGLPRFLSGFLRLIFNSESGTPILLENPSFVAIRAVRQICSLLSKLDEECSPERTSQALKQFSETDSAISPSFDEDEFLAMSQLLFGDALNEMERKLFSDGIKPKHGPGAVAEKISSNAKWVFPTWPSRLNEYFPYWDYASTIYRDESDAALRSPALVQDEPARLIAVPKTAKTPRLISIEPVALQYVQQGLLELIEDSVCRTPAWDLMGWRDHEPNRVLAKASSSSGSHATLDLSEASDRVSARHAEVLLQRNQFLKRSIFSARSQQVDTPDGVISVKKFASMGSALCFPIESMVFVTCALIGIQRSRGSRLGPADIKRLSGQVRVYGDDIIVPRDTTHEVIRVLGQHGFKVNKHKSFWSGSFRESCGSEFYSGFDVSFVKVRDRLPRIASDANGIVSWIDLHNRFYDRGMFDTARAIAKYLDGLRGRLPRVPVDSPAVGLWDFDERNHRYGYDDAYQVRTLRAYQYVSKSPLDPLQDHAALLKFFALRDRSSVPIERGHLDRAGRPTSGHIKRKWTPVRARG